MQRAFRKLHGMAVQCRSYGCCARAAFAEEPILIDPNFLVLWLQVRRAARLCSVCCHVFVGGELRPGADAADACAPQHAGAAPCTWIGHGPDCAVTARCTHCEHTVNTAAACTQLHGFSKQQRPAKMAGLCAWVRAREIVRSHSRRF